MKSSDTVWCFVLGRLTPEKFEKWLYASWNDPEVSTLLGDGLIQTALETDYRDARQVASLRRTLREELTVLPSCRCITWCDDQILVLGIAPESGGTQTVDEFLASFRIVRRRTPWLYAMACRQCGQAWYLAVDSQSDRYYLHRLDAADTSRILAGDWPDLFDQNPSVWPSQDWLSLYGYSSLEDWQERNQRGAGD